MNSKNIQNPGEVFKTFSHKTKINSGNVNDDVLMMEIKEITEKISLLSENDKAMPFNRITVTKEDLRPDEIGEMKSVWIKAANETKDGFICVSEIMDGKDIR